MAGVEFKLKEVETSLDGGNNRTVATRVSSYFGSFSYFGATRKALTRKVLLLENSRGLDFCKLSDFL